MTGILQDLRYAGRGLRKSPGFVAIAILTLALGIGANIAVFSVLNAILLNPSGVPHPDSVVALRVKYANVGDLQNIEMSAPDFGDAVTGKQMFTSAAALQTGDFNYSGEATTPERLIGARVTWQWFDVFWARPYLGRVFASEEDQPNATHEVVLSYATWKRRFGGDRNIIGQRLLLNQESYQVVGVMGPDFDWPNNAELWTPLGLPSGRYFDSDYRYNENLFAVARLRPDVTVAQANAYLQLKSAQNIESEGSNSYGRSSGWGMFSMPLVEFVSGDLRRPLWILFAAVATVLLIACANIAGLQLARASGRQHETSIQIALGAGNGRLIQQAFLESLIIGIGGVGLGLWLAVYIARLLLFFAPQSLARNITVHMGGPVLFFVAGIGVLAVLLCGTAPAWHATHTRWFQTLQEAGRSAGSGHGRQRMRSLLVVAEIGMAMLLLVSAGLLVRSLKEVEQLQTGFNPQGVMSAELSLPEAVYKTPEQQAAFYNALEEQLKNIPGASTAGITDGMPFSGSNSAASFGIKGRAIPPNGAVPHGKIRTVSPGYFETLQIPLLRGRLFGTQDRMNTEPVAVIDETLARQYWPNQDPIGQQIIRSMSAPPITIVGIVKHAKASSLESDTNEGFYYICLNQRPRTMSGIVVRAANGRPEGLIAGMKAAVRQVDPNQPLYDIKSMEQRVDDSLIGRRFLVVLLSGFAGLALLLAALGLYGVISYSVRLRTRELGIRMALGAERSDVIRLILRQGVRLAAAGLMLGFALTLMAGRALSSLLYDVRLFNPLTIIMTTVLLIATVLFASYLPAYRATRVEPVVALRDE